MPKAVRQPATIAFDDFTQSVTSAILRASQARKIRVGPILVGIIWWPDGLDKGSIRLPGQEIRP